MLVMCLAIFPRVPTMIEPPVLMIHTGMELLCAMRNFKKWQTMMSSSLSSFDAIYKYNMDMFSKRKAATTFLHSYIPVPLSDRSIHLPCTTVYSTEESVSPAASVLCRERADSSNMTFFVSGVASVVQQYGVLLHNRPNALQFTCSSDCPLLHLVDTRRPRDDHCTFSSLLCTDTFESQVNLLHTVLEFHSLQHC